MRPQAAHARVVLEAEQLDLELALGRAAWSAKMSRMIAVRSMTGMPSSSSRLRSWRGSSSSSTAIRFASASLAARFSSVELPAAEVAVRIGPLATLDHLAGHRDAGGAKELAELGQVAVVEGDADRQRALGGASRRAVLDCIHRFKSRDTMPRHESVRDRRNGVHRDRVVQRLRDRGDEVVVLARRPQKAGELDAEVVQGDLSDADAIRRGMEGCQAVFHIAADYRVGMDPSKQDSMRGLEHRRHRARAGRGGGRGRRQDRLRLDHQRVRQHQPETVDESYRRDEADGFVSTYDETKYRAHLAEQRAARAPIVIVQPGSVYGPGDHALVGQMIDQASTGKMPAKAFPELGLNMVHVDDVADGIMLAYDKGKPGESYVLGGEITTQGA